MLDIEQAIREVRAAYLAITGRPIESGLAELPPEVDPVVHIDGRYRQLRAMLEARGYGSYNREPSICPPTDVIQSEQELRCEVELPGVTRDQVTICIVGEFLIIRAERPSPPTNGAAMHHHERPTGSLQRIITLPPRVRRDAANAVLRDGLLTVTLHMDGSHSDAKAVEVGVK